MCDVVIETKQSYILLASRYVLRYTDIDIYRIYKCSNTCVIFLQMQREKENKVLS